MQDTFEPFCEAEDRFWKCELPPPDRGGFAGTAAEYAAVLEAVERRNDQLKIETGFAEAIRRQHETIDVEWDISDQVFAIPARTVEGIRFKLEIMKEREGCLSEEMEPSLRSDLLHMVGIYDA